MTDGDHMEAKAEIRESDTPSGRALFLSAGNQGVSLDISEVGSEQSVEAACLTLLENLAGISLTDIVIAAADAVPADADHASEARP